jgi:hypothetical protein
MDYSGLIGIILSGYLLVSSLHIPVFPRLSEELERIFELQPTDIAKKVSGGYGTLGAFLGVVMLPPSWRLNIFVWLQNNVAYLIIAVFLLAGSPSLVRRKEAREEEKTRPERLVGNKQSCIGNFKYNFVGATVAGLSLMAATSVVQDYYGIYRLHLSLMVNVLLISCVMIGVSFQKAEQSDPTTKTQADAYDPSLHWLNQRLNLYHLINVYFFSFLSAILISTYSYYCFKNGYKLQMSFWVYVQYSIVLLFFYMCAYTNKYHNYILFQETVPWLLFLFYKWLNWFEHTVLAYIFLGAHIGIYILISKYRKGKVSGHRQIPFNYINHIVAIILFLVMLSTTQSIERIPEIRIGTYLGVIEKDDYMEQIQNLPFFNENSRDIDATVLLDFLNSNFAAELKKRDCYPATIERLDMLF